MYLEWYLKEQAAGEKTLEETVVELLAEKRIPYNDGRILYRWDDRRHSGQCGRSIGGTE